MSQQDAEAVVDQDDTNSGKFDVLFVHLWRLGILTEFR